MESDGKSSNSDQVQESDVQMDVQIAVVDHPVVRRAKILRVHTKKLSDAFENFDADLTKSLLLDVEIELSDIETDIPIELSDSDFEFVSHIIDKSKDVVSTVNKAISFASKSFKANTEAGSSSSDQLQPFDDIKIHYKPFVFDGNIRNWVEFWDRYNATIYSRPRFNNVTKFSFLIECLKGKAFELVRGLAITDANFEAAIRKLKERYDNPDRLATSYYDELKELVEADDASTQRLTYDSVQKILNNLESLGHSIDQDIMKGSIMTKFSEFTLRGALACVRRNEDRTYSVRDLMVAIDQTLIIEEDIERVKGKKKNTSEKIATGVFVGGNKPPSSSKRPQSSGSGGGPIRTQRKKECIFCNSDAHNSHDCSRFTTMARRRNVLRKKGLCYICGSSHLASSCPVSELKCQLCHKVGHLMHLCISHMIQMNEKNKKERETKFQGNSGSGTFLQTFICLLSNPEVTNKSLKIRGLLDQGSKKSYVNEWVCRKLGVKPRESTSLSCFHFGSTESYEINTHEVVLTLGNIFNSNERTYSLTSTPCITGDFRTCPEASSVKSNLPEHGNYADEDIFISNQRNIDLLIGGNLYNQLVDIFHPKKVSEELILYDTFFGLVPSGNIIENRDKTSALLAVSLNEPTASTSSVQNVDVNTSSELGLCTSVETDEPVTDFSDLTDLSLFWSLETIGIKLSEVDNVWDKVLEQFDKTRFISNNRYVVCWPWKHENLNLTSNYRIAKARLRSLVSSASPELLSGINDIFSDYLNKGIIELAPLKTPHKIHYLPHRGIHQKGKTRMVFDGSSKPKNGHSVNELIHTGPSLHENVIKLLINFRLNPVAVTADIEKAFLQIGLNEVDRDVTRFLWLKDINKPADNYNIIHYRFARVCFGINASPFLLNVVLQEHLSSSPANQWHLLAKESFYVDNLVVSLPDTESAINLHHSLISKFNAISMNLRDWASNDSEFINSLDEKLKDKSPGLISILGLPWDRHLDNLFVKLNEDISKEPNKRNVLKFLASIFDPLGLFSPSTLKLKLLLQDCWKNKYDWSERLPSRLEAEINKIRSDLMLIPKIPISRRLWKFEKPGHISLHIFCDASKSAFACCAYLIYHNPETCESASTLILSKVRTAPIKEITIPRLELLGVLIEIKRAPGLTVHHISGKQNPADIASRGESVSDLGKSKTWWNGPSWITCKVLWPSAPLNSEPFSTTNHVESVSLIGETSIPHFLTGNIENKFSSWSKRLRIFEHVIRYCHILRMRVTDNTSPLDNVEISIKAEKALMRELQRKYYGKEHRIALRAKLDFLDQGLPVPEHLRLKSDLDLFMDDDFLLRCGGRMEHAPLAWDTIHPILLPNKSPVTRSFVVHSHLMNKHIGLSHLLSKLREKYWIPKCRVLIKSVLHNCVGCKRWTGGAYRLPDMPPLPRERVEETAPFLNVGIDLMGPVKIKSGNSAQPVYVVMFACLVTRAIHLEIARDTSAIEFLRTFSRFCSIRGCPKFVVTDNASNFVFIQPMVGDKVNITSRGILDHSSLNDISWRFIPQYSPWQGGAYERLIGLLKLCIRKSYSNLLLDYVDFLTALYEIADILNGRPLTFVSSDEIISSLTPNHFLRLRPNCLKNHLDIRTNRTDLSARKLLDLWQHIKGVVNNFWSAFETEYLTFLREKHVRSHTHPRGSSSQLPQEGDVVLVKEPGAPRGYWKMGKIISLDSRKAVAVVKCKNIELTRSVNFLYPLELTEISDSNSLD